MPEPIHAMLAEIREQPSVLDRMLREHTREFSEAARALRAAGAARVVAAVAARG